MPNLISKILWNTLGYFAFNRISVIHAERIPRSGAVLFIATHRNGAMDAAPYYKAIPDALTLVSVQLQRGLLGRLLFPGIPVARDKDRQRGMQADNLAALDEAVGHLAKGDRLLVFPEGTSSLGSRHLPFKKGAARIAQRALEQRIPLTIVPLAVHYQAPTEWQSRVEILVGESILTADIAAYTVIQLQAAFTAALESVGINVDSARTYDRLSRLAYCATLETDVTYALALKRFEHSLADKLADADLELDEAIRQTHPALHQGLPLLPTVHPLACSISWSLLAPVMLSAAILNAPVLGVASWASRALSDDINVIAFWRMLVGVPAAALWTSAMFILLWGTAHTLAAVLYVALSLIGVRMYYPWKRLSVALYNLWRKPRIVVPFRTYCRTIIAHMNPEVADVSAADD